MISTIAVPNRRVGVPLVMIAGICWSTSGLIYRLIENASPWQVLFYRSLALFVMLAIWLSVNYRKNFFTHHDSKSYSSDNHANPSNTCYCLP